MMPLRALSLVRREPRLRRLAFAPALLNLVALAVGVVVLVAVSGTYWDVASAWLASPRAAEWYTWIWAGPLWLLVGIGRILLWLLLSGLTLLAALMIAAAAAAPVQDALAAATEEVCGASHLESAGWTRSLWIALRMVGGQMARLLLFLVLQVAVLAVGMVPLVGLVAPVLAFVVTVVFMCLECTSWPMDRRAHSFGERWTWLRTHQRGAAGFGTTAALMMMVPLANVIAMPVLVVAGTMLYLETVGPAVRADVGPAAPAGA